ncbi:EamA family transporter [Bacillus toyonensis]|uniref:DMT family transporter n=1 Tax=Bacillus toyonensis TaxID=155322 RepID=UPI0002F0BBA6|nr:DMT family transporter [Bacillus toyonensis]PKR93896.1 Phenylalanine--tRNA ligase alpha subunit [Bacillus cereus Rock4-18]PED94504.1 EamA family transporter [Bacillus toyonensis]PEJ66814.1 EamA family transporter [Bacillus toyonensis]PEK53029.1 EamA family transporter [Bacillus toyonensis]PEL55521.1 EamA family transporter [Bacillus toyonensis]
MRRWGIELLILSVVMIWGINYTIAKYGLVEFTAIEFTAIRMMAAAPLLLLLTFFIEKSLYVERKDIPRLIVVSFVGIVLYQTLFMETVKYTSATNASLLISISPIFTTLFAVFLKQEKFSSRKLIGSMIAFVGAALVLVAGHSLASSFYGNGIGMITSICWGLYPVLAGPLIKKYSALRVTAWSALVGAIPLLLLSGPHVFVMPFHITKGMTLFALLYSIFFVTVFGLVMWYIGVQKIGASHTMVYMYITPIVAVLFAAIWANESISLQQMIGGIIIFFGLWFVKLKKVKVHTTVQEPISK